MAEVLRQRLVEAPAGVVAATLARSERWLEDAAERAGAGGEAVDGRMRADIGRGPAQVQVTKRVSVTVGVVNEVGGRYVVPVTWEARGFAGMFPVMDSVIEVHAAGADRSRLVFWGRYDPPLGRMGDVIDRLIAHAVAEATVDGLLDAVAARITSEPVRPAS